MKEKYKIFITWAIVVLMLILVFVQGGLMATNIKRQQIIDEKIFSVEKTSIETQAKLKHSNEKISELETRISKLENTK